MKLTWRTLHALANAGDASAKRALSALAGGSPRIGGATVRAVRGDIVVSWEPLS